MIIKIFKSNERSGRDCINYLLGEDFRREGSVILSGSAVLTAQVIDSLKFKKKYVSGCLSFSEKELDFDHQIDIMNLFMDVVRGYLLSHQINFLWIRHLDKKNLELNFVIPCVDLVTLKHVDLLMPSRDRDLCYRFSDYIDSIYNLNSPRDPINNRLLCIDRYDSQDDIQLKEYMHAEVCKSILNKKILSRDNLIDFFEAYQMDFEKAYKKMIVFKNRSDGKIFYFKGEVYSEDFTFSSNYFNELEYRSEKFKKELCNNSDYFYQEVFRLVELRRNRYKRFEISDGQLLDLSSNTRSHMETIFGTDELSLIEGMMLTVMNSSLSVNTHLQNTQHADEPSLEESYPTYDGDALSM